MRASVVIANYNNAIFINDCINSIRSQTYNDIEIIFFDDNSQDTSLEVIKEYKDIKTIENKKQTKFGSFNQMNAFKRSIQMSTGDIIFLLDSDDFFGKDKIEKVIKFFLENKNENIVFDFPILKRNNIEIPQKKKNNLFNTYWGYIHPTSCISIRRSYSDKLLDKVLNFNYPDIWLDLRILLFSKYLHKYNTLNEHLTFYRQFDGNISSKFKRFSKAWWQRRYEAHEYFLNFVKLNDLKINKNFDFFITKLINKFL